jgi:hypothetical protein
MAPAARATVGPVPAGDLARARAGQGDRRFTPGTLAGHVRQRLTDFAPAAWPGPWGER